MKNKFKVFFSILLIFMILLNSTYVFATEANNDNKTNITSSKVVSQELDLELTNILCIIIIAIGILLILLSIAILIRLKNK